MSIANLSSPSVVHSSQIRGMRPLSGKSRKNKKTKTKNKYKHTNKHKNKRMNKNNNKKDDDEFEQLNLNKGLAYNDNTNGKYNNKVTLESLQSDNKSNNNGNEKRYNFSNDESNVDAYTTDEDSDDIDDIDINLLSSINNKLDISLTPSVTSLTSEEAVDAVTNGDNNTNTNTNSNANSNSNGHAKKYNHKHKRKHKRKNKHKNKNKHKRKRNENDSNQHATRQNNNNYNNHLSSNNSSSNSNSEYNSEAESSATSSDNNGIGDTGSSNVSGSTNSLVNSVLKEIPVPKDKATLAQMANQLNKIKTTDQSSSGSNNNTDRKEEDDVKLGGYTRQRSNDVVVPGYRNVIDTFFFGNSAYENTVRPTRNRNRSAQATYNREDAKTNENDGNGNSNNDGGDDKDGTSIRGLQSPNNGHKSSNVSLTPTSNKGDRRHPKSLSIGSIDSPFNGSTSRKCLFEIRSDKAIKIDYGLPEGPFTLYFFKIKYLNNIQWVIKKRFSEFLIFHKEIESELKRLAKVNNKNKNKREIPKLPPKTFRKCFDDTFVLDRHKKLTQYLNNVLKFNPIISSDLGVLTFLGAVDNMTMKYNDKFLESRMAYTNYVNELADTGDIILFQTKGYLAASMRTVTSSEYDHVGVVCKAPGKKDETFEELHLLEATADGVKKYKLLRRLRQWSILCPQIVVKRRKQTKKTREYYKLARQFVDKVDGLQYCMLLFCLLFFVGFICHSLLFFLSSFVCLCLFVFVCLHLVVSLYVCVAIWSNIVKTGDTTDINKHKKFFCSQLVTAYLRFTDSISKDIKAQRVLPGHFSDASEKCTTFLGDNYHSETLLLFKLPAVGNAKPQYTRPAKTKEANNKEKKEKKNVENSKVKGQAK